MAIAEEDQKARKCKATCQLRDGIPFPKILQSDDSGLSKSVLGGGTSTQQKTLQKQKCAQTTFLMVNRPPATRLQCSLCHLVKSSSQHRRKEELSRSTTVHLSHYQYYKHHILNQSKLFITPSCYVLHHFSYLGMLT